MMTKHADFQKRFNRHTKIFTWTWRIMLASILTFWIAVGYGGYKIYQNVDFSHGLQGVVHQVWTGDKL